MGVGGAIACDVLVVWGLLRMRWGFGGGGGVVYFVKFVQCSVGLESEHFLRRQVGCIV